ncbi:MAG: energy-coupling factor transporter transmembrane component T [Oscillospiraceae bacterium]
MLKDITFGQYIFGKSVIHRLDPRLKIMCTILFIFMLFASTNPIGICATILFSIILFAVAKIPLKLVRKSLKPIIPIVLFTSVLNMFFMSGDPLFTIWKLTITKQGVYFAIILSLRIVCLIAGSSLLTYTTSPIELTDGIESLLSPLKRFKMPVHELAMMMTIALRFIPTLIEETDKIMSAQKSRGANLDTGNFITRVKALVPVLVPLFISSFRRADELALAMECRCYHGGEGRTRLKRLIFKPVDLWASIVFLIVFAFVVSINFIIPLAVI